MDNREQNNSSKKEILQSFKSAQTQNYTMLGQYIPVHKYDGKNKIKVKAASSPVKNTEIHKFCIYEGDYVPAVNIDKKEIYKKFAKKIFVMIKSIFINPQLVKFFSLEEKNLKIQQTIAKIETINNNVDKMVSRFEGKSVMNEQKYLNFYEKLKMSDGVQFDIKKELSNEQ